METPFDPVIDCVIRHARRLIQGDYSGNGLYEYTKEEHPPKVRELAECVGMMSVKLEAREEHLRRHVEELRKANAELCRIMRERVISSYVLIKIVAMMCLYAFFIHFVGQKGLVSPGDDERVQELASRGLELALVTAIGLFIWRSGLTRREVGLTLENAGASLRHGAIFSAGVLALLIGLRLILERTTGLFAGLPFVSLERLAPGPVLAYLVVSVVQEIITRGAVQGAIERVITGPRRHIWAAALAAMVFGVYHLHYSAAISLAVTLGGFGMGLLYIRTRTIIGVSLAHWLMGLGLMAFGYWDVMN